MGHLKRMNKASSALYNRATELGLPDGLRAGFKEDFDKFKRVWSIYLTG